MDTDCLINVSDDETDPEIEGVHLHQQLRGPSLDDLVDLGISIRSDAEGNAYTGVDFRGLESLSPNLRLDNLKVDNCTTGSDRESDLTEIKVIGTSVTDVDATLQVSQEMVSANSAVAEPTNINVEGSPCSSPSESYDDSNTGITRGRSHLPLSDGKKYHVFFSYDILDRDWVEETVRRLESPDLGFRCSIHERDFHGGKRIIENITEHIRISEKTVLVLSPDFIQSQWCRFEIELGMVLSMEESQLLLVPVMVRQCDVPDSIKTLTYIDATEGSDWWQRFMDAITSHDSLLATFTGAKDFTIHPRYDNMDILTEVSSTFEWCSGDQIRAPYIPEILMRPGIEISVEDFDDALDNIRLSSDCFCKCFCDIGWICIPVFILFLMSGLVVMPMLVSVYSHSLDTRFFTCVFVLGPPWILTTVGFLYQGYKRKKRLRKAVNAANEVFLKHNVIMGVTVFTSACMFFKIKLSFWYFNISKCQKQLQTFLESTERFTDNEDYQTLSKKYAMKLLNLHCDEYTTAYMRGKLRPKNGTRHGRRTSCLCQFIEAKYQEGKPVPDIVFC